MDASQIVRTLDARRVLPVFAVVAVLCGVVAVFDILLVRAGAHHRSEIGTRLYQRGLSATQAGRTSEALELFRSAYNHNPANADYHLAFARALEAAGRAREANAVLERLLTARPAHGPANVEMARALSRAGDWQTAAWYYHRAIYGQWRGSPDVSAIRYELAELLARHGATEELAAEVATLTSEDLRGIDARRLARLALAAREWRRAESLYATLLRTAPDDAGLLTGLARAQVGNGRFVAAERNLRRAVAHSELDAGVHQDLELVSRINAMDPTLRRLHPREKHRRAHDVATTLLARLQACSADSDVAAASLNDLKGHDRRRDYLSMAEADLDVVDTTWSSLIQLCGSGTDLPPHVELLARQLAK